MKKFLRVFRTEEEYLEYTASTEFNLNSVSRCREGSLVFYDPADCGSQGIHRTISGETYCDGYDKRVYLYKQVSYDGGVTWETTATTSSLVEKNSEDCGYVPPTPPSDWDITAKFNVTSTGPTKIASGTSSFNKIEIDGVELPSVTDSYTFSTTGEHTVKYSLKNTSIGDFAFGDCIRLTSCVIGSGVTDISHAAFANCSNITSVIISDSVTSIGTSAFRNCSSLTSIYIPNSVTSIDEGAFYYCSGLTSVTIPSGITSIERSTFIGCTSLSNVNIPSGVTSIGISAFHWCSSLTSVIIPDSVTNINSSAFAQCTALSSCTIGSGVTSIGVQTFNNCRSLTSIVIPDSVTSIGQDAFQYCTSLTSCTIGSGIKRLDRQAFYGCRSLKSITSKAMVEPTIHSSTFGEVARYGTLYVPQGSSGYDVWMGTSIHYLGYYNWTKVEQ